MTPVKRSWLNHVLRGVRDCPIEKWLDGFLRFVLLSVARGGGEMGRERGEGREGCDVTERRRPIVRK